MLGQTCGNCGNVDNCGWYTAEDCGSGYSHWIPKADEIEAEHEAETELLNMLGTGEAREKLIEHIKTDTLENMVNFPEHVYENTFSKF
jgi:hypothetical protein